MFVLWACGETPAFTAPDSLPASSTHCFPRLRETSGTETETMAFHTLCLQALLLTAFLSYCAHSGKTLPSLTSILYICDWVHSLTHHMNTVNLQVDAFKCHSMLPRDKIVTKNRDLERGACMPVSIHFPISLFFWDCWDQPRLDFFFFLRTVWHLILKEFSGYSIHLVATILDSL